MRNIECGIYCSVEVCACSDVATPFRIDLGLTIVSKADSAVSTNKDPLSRNVTSLGETRTSRLFCGMKGNRDVSTLLAEVKFALVPAFFNDCSTSKKSSLLRMSCPERSPLGGDSFSSSGSYGSPNSLCEIVSCSGFISLQTSKRLASPTSS
jgi:hypothetical protein